METGASFLVNVHQVSYFCKIETVFPDLLVFVGISHNVKQIHSQTLSLLFSLHILIGNNSTHRLNDSTTDNTNVLPLLLSGKGLSKSRQTRSIGTPTLFSHLYTVCIKPLYAEEALATEPSKFSFSFPLPKYPPISVARYYPPNCI